MHRLVQNIWILAGEVYDDNGADVADVDDMDDDHNHDDGGDDNDDYNDHYHDNYEQDDCAELLKVADVQTHVCTNFLWTCAKCVLLNTK